MAKPTTLPRLTKAEILALDKVYNILSKMQSSYQKSDILMSTKTGEVLKLEELSRTKGILSFFIDAENIVLCDP